MMSRIIPTWLAVALVLLNFAVLAMFGALVKHRSQGGNGYGIAGQVAMTLANVPSSFRTLLHARPYAQAAEDRQPLPAGWQRPAGSSFVDPGYLLASEYAPGPKRFVVRLIDLRSGKILHEYAPDIAAYDTRTYPMMHPHLTADGGLIFKNFASLVRVDACGKQLWSIKGVFHHSTEGDSQGNVWVPLILPKSQRKNVLDIFREDGIALVSEGGKLLRQESLVTIFSRNGLGYLYDGRPYLDDPFHLNDIEPVLSDGPYWKKGDLFLSMRNLSMVLLYRPATGRVLWWQQGPWLAQHDVNVIDDHRISIFDNQTVSGVPDYVRGHNRVVVRDFSTGALTSPLQKEFAALDLRTIMEGRATPLAGGDYMVEESDYGRVLRLGASGAVRWQYIAADEDRKRYKMAWSRYLDPGKEAAGIRAASMARCEKK